MIKIIIIIMTIRMIINNINNHIRDQRGSRSKSKLFGRMVRM